MTEHAPPQPSQTSSHFQIEPVSGATLFEQETRRRDALARRGRCLTGCLELDDQVLLGGFERGCVVGISAEDEDVGLLIGLQTVARLFVDNLRTGKGTAPRATVITTLSVGSLLPILRDTFKAQLVVAQLVAQIQEPGKGSELLKQYLETISISRVFDVSGLWEALEEVNCLSSHNEPPQEPRSSRQAAGEDEVAASQTAPKDERDQQEEEANTAELSSSPLSDPPSSLPDEMDLVDAGSGKPPQAERTEVADSEDEHDSLSSFSRAETSPEPERAGMVVPEENRSKDKQASVNQPDIDQSKTSADRRHADIVLITHMSTILSSLFRLREKDIAHQTVQLLSAQLRYLSHSPKNGGPLTIILNSTTSSQEALSGIDKSPGMGQEGPSSRAPPPPEAPNPRGPSRTLDPTLRSIFNPPPLSAACLGYAHDTPLSRRNKPSFGLIFSQMLDMHLMCSRVPRTRADAEALFAPQRRVAGGVGPVGVGYGWAVEVLLDEVGVWGARRASREQRWGAVDVRRDGDGARVVDAFGAPGPGGKPVPETE
ncbi:hypothetical protein DHEL01_v210550 [Diaporthe helianthi]|uniref:Fasciclin domain family protein n=1 Tax=Diaporthe helianthi TaxID=158607 RepID=A0A2P5HLD3_DIAHE|nr:hypothetical protein DHEL01_v210550 [Diaporthe helianthi]